MKALLIGLGPTALSALDSLHEKLDVVGVVRNLYPARHDDGDPTWSAQDLDNWVPGRRLGDLSEDLVARRADELGLKLYTDVAPTAIGKLVRTVRPDCVVVSSYNRLLPVSALEAAHCVNVHYTPLPRYRGRGEWPIINDEPFTAVSVHTVEKGADTGNILFQEIVPIHGRETIAELYERLNAVQQANLGDAVARHIEGFAGVPQRQEAATYGCTSDCDIRGAELPGDGEIEWSAPTREVDCLVRGLGYPWPGAHTYFRGERLTVWRAEQVVDAPHYVGRVPGRVVEISRSGGWIDVLTGDGVLRVLEVQEDGGTPRAAATLVRSLSDTLGMRTSDLLNRIHSLEGQVVRLSERLSSARAE